MLPWAGLKTPRRGRLGKVRPSTRAALPLAPGLQPPAQLTSSPRAAARTVGLDGQVPEAEPREPGARWVGHLGLSDLSFLAFQG